MPVGKLSVTIIRIADAKLSHVNSDLKKVVSDDLVDIDIGTDGEDRAYASTSSSSNGTQSEVRNPYCIVNVDEQICTTQIIHESTDADSPCRNCDFMLKKNVNTLKIEVLDSVSNTRTEDVKAQARSHLASFSRKLALLAVGSPLDYPSHMDGIGEESTEASNPIVKESRGHLVGTAVLPLRKVFLNWVSIHDCHIQDEHGRYSGKIKVALVFIPIILEGWLKKNIPNNILCVGDKWQRHWYQLLADGRFLCWKTPFKRKREFVGVIHLEKIKKVSSAAKFEYFQERKKYFEITDIADQNEKSRTCYFQARNEYEGEKWLEYLMEVWKRGNAKVDDAAAPKLNNILSEITEGVKLYV